MSEHSGIQVFISYSRNDSATVEKLAATLVGMGYDPWVDRTRLEGGMEWEKEIRRAIESSLAFVLVLTPDSARSEWVNFEFMRARSLKKVILPLLFKPVDISILPVHWGELQHIDMQGNYDDGIKRLASRLRHAAVASPKPAEQQASAQHTQRKGLLQWFGFGGGKTEPQLSPDMVKDLYRRAAQAIAAKDYVTAARLLQEILDDNPHALGGRVQATLRKIQSDVTQQHISRLNHAIVQARASGDWLQEYALLGELSRLRRLDASESERMAQAKQNQAYQDRYNLIIGLVEDGSYATAIADLRDLWRQTKDYGDPAGLASRLHILTPRQDAAVQAATAAASDAERSADRATAAAAQVDVEVRKAQEGIQRGDVEDAREASSEAEATARTVAAATQAAIEATQAARKAATEAPGISQVADAVTKAEKAEKQARQAEASAAQAAASVKDAEARAQDVQKEQDSVALQQAIDAYERRMEKWEDDIKTPTGFRTLILDQSAADLWISFACLLYGSALAIGMVTQSLLLSVAIIIALAVLGYFSGYRRVLEPVPLVGIAAIAAVTAAAITWQPLHLYLSFVRLISIPGNGSVRSGLVYAGPFTQIYAGIWAGICAVLGTFVGYVIGEESDVDPRLAAFGGLIAGAVIGGVGGLITALAVERLGWQNSGFFLGLVITLLLCAWILWFETIEHFSSALAAALTTIAIIAVITVLLFTILFHQGVSSGLLWTTGLVCGGILGVGLASWTLVLKAAIVQHPFPERRPTLSDIQARRPRLHRGRSRRARRR